MKTLSFALLASFAALGLASLAQAQPAPRDFHRSVRVVTSGACSEAHDSALTQARKDLLSACEGDRCAECDVRDVSIVSEERSQRTDGQCEVIAAASGKGYACAVDREDSF